jgi:nickel transport protein
MHRSAWFAFGLVLTVITGPALAHKLRVFALPEGNRISGYTYFGGGERVSGITVRMFGPNGEALGEVVSDDRGGFVFEAKARVDHRLEADAGSGHLAEFVVRAEDLSAGVGDEPAGPAAPMTPTTGFAPTGMTAAVSTPPSVVTPPLEEQIERAVARQLRPLREQLEQYEQSVRWHDVLGGIGYILGLAGLAGWLLGRRPPAT